MASTRARGRIREGQAEVDGAPGEAEGSQGENMRRARDVTLIKRFARGEDDGRDTRLGACLVRAVCPS